MRGDRYDTVKPKDSDFLRGDGAFASETSKHADFTAVKGERFDPMRPTTSDIWKVCIPLRYLFLPIFISVEKHIFKISMDP